MTIWAHVSLASNTTFRIGGKAQWYVEPTSVHELVDALAFASRSWLAVNYLGGGSNILVSDAGVEGLVVHVAGMGGEFGRIESLPGQEGGWRIGAGVPLSRFVSEMANNGMAGVEELAGIPGMVGGALAMNAGSREFGIGDIVQKVRVIYPNGTERELGRNELSFGYRKSNLDKGLVISADVFFEKRAKPGELLERIRQRKEIKVKSQPVAMASAGCIFKNPDDRSAGQLLDQAGCKGMSRGGALVSPVHANFVVNQDNATAVDVVSLIRDMREIVFSRFGVKLELEIKLWGIAPGELE